MYNIPENQVALVYNFIDLDRVFKFHPVTTELIDKYKLLEADLICVYPTRMTSAKQPDKLVKLMAAIRDQGQKVKLIVCNTWSNA